MLAEPVDCRLLSDDPVDHAVARMTLDLEAIGRARVPRLATPVAAG